MKTKTLHQKVTFPAAPEAVWDMLMDSKKHSEFTGDKAVISRKEGEKYTAYDDYIDGKNIKLVPGKLIVQTWHASDWPEGHYSETTYKFKKKGKGTEMEFTHKDVPAEFASDIAEGWKDFYWKPMKELLKKN
jgi:activator of HSP90 ATPase